MRKAVIGFVILSSIPVLSAHGETITQTRDVGSFSKVFISGSIDADIKAGEEQRVAIRADADVQDDITTEVRGDTLIIKMKGRHRDWGDLHAFISTPELEGIGVNGSSDVTASGIDSSEFEASINGSGDMRLSGRCDEVEYEINGSGDIEATELKCQNAEVEINGSGDTDIYVSGRLEVDISGSGDVTAYGKPTVEEVSVSGSGSFKSKD